MAYHVQKTSTHLFFLNTFEHGVVYISLNVQTALWRFYIDQNSRSMQMNVDDDGNFSFESSFSGSIEVREKAIDAMKELLFYMKNDPKYKIYLLMNTKLSQGVRVIWNEK